ncbi:MAG: monovalent cation/H(+) antiporter subunit G [Alphaproteobacteria bacterium]|jgi:multicomponent Na+:H+ antiporter subunit G|nr:monovalent cation/H(+) antiporter subunit G [Alphaproteobacteria bacterium]
MVLDVLSWITISAGAFFILAGGIGLIRLPDVFCRVHAAGLTDTVGAGLMLTGLMLQAGATLVTVKLVLIMVFLIFTSPTASYALAHAALLDGIKPWTKADRKERKP